MAACGKTVILAHILILLIPITIFIGLFNYMTYGISHNDENRHFISPMRSVLALGLPIYVAVKGVKKKSLDRSGAFCGILVGFIMTLANFCFCSAMLAFYFSGSKVTKFRPHLKRKLEADYKEGGQRTWVQVACTSGMAACLALLYVIETGCGEFPVNFSAQYSVSWLSTSVVGILACSNGDTWASEIGAVVGSGQPRLLTSFTKVPPGTNGAVSLVGLAASVVGGAVVGVAFYAAQLICISPDILEVCPPQWPIIYHGAACGFVGSLVDSLLGCMLQYSGIHEDTGQIVEFPGPKVQGICGYPFLDNHGVNLVSTALMAFISPSIAVRLWGYYRS